MTYSEHRGVSCFDCDHQPQGSQPEKVLHETRKPNNMIRVEYNGEYANTCNGTLQIYDDENLLYNEQCCCTSTGSVGIDENGDGYIIEGELLWNEDEASKFSPEIQRIVKDVLSDFRVCCGGCL